MRYYIYLSDAKVEMLHSQTRAGGLAERAFEFGFDFKFLKALTKSKVSVTQHHKLEDILNELFGRDEIGTADEPKNFFQGKEIAYWGPLSIEGQSGRTPIVYFTGRTKKGTVFGLGGSIKHIIGSIDNPGAQPRHLSPSLAPVLQQYLEPVIGGIGYPGLQKFFVDAPFLQAAIVNELGLRPPKGLHWEQALEMVRSQEGEKALYKGIDHLLRITETGGSNRFEPGPAQELEFVAKKFGQRQLPSGVTVTFGTPLYVSYA